MDTRSTQINEDMKLAAVHALATLAREDVPDYVSATYGGKSFKFGREYLIPKPFDSRVLMWVAPAVAKAAIKSGVATRAIEDWGAYRERLEALQGPSKVFIRSAINRVRENTIANGGHKPRMVFPEGTSARVLKAICTLVEEGICEPILIGYPERIAARIKELDLKGLDEIQVVHTSSHPKFKDYARELYRRRHRKGVNLEEAERLMADPNYFASMMVELGDADCLVTGSQQNYADAVRPILKTIGMHTDGVPAGLNFILLEDKMILLTDTAVNINPSAEECAKIAMQAIRVAEFFGVDPSVAMLSYSSFTGNDGTPAKMKKAAELVKKMRPDISVDGDIQADTAVNPELVEKLFPFSDLKAGANILIFPNLESANITYKLIQQLGKMEVLGPFLMGIRHSANVLQRTATVDQIVNSAVLTALEAQYIADYRKKSVR